MKNTLVYIGLAFLMSCSTTTSIQLTIPDAFKQQATMQHVNGSRSNKMSFANFSTSRIRRGVHVTGPGRSSGPTFFWENLVLNHYGIQKDINTVKEKTKFRYTLTDGKNNVKVYAQEKAVTVHLEYQMIHREGLLSSYEQLQQYNYLFSAIISTDSTPNSKSWELQMTNIYDRKEQNDKNPFAHHTWGDNGLATNGSDTIFIKPIKIEKSVSANGVERQIPFKILSGYELSTPDGVIAIVDLLNRNIWFYNELDASEKLNIGAIATAIFARKVHGE